ncbi:Gfo/Idh/MocA family oxidoreductase [Terrabacter sp. NPDC000476]|uniref:Gfo/Idh/MocA family protein n=1 Tax=Terrabacter sp. NPDC000476 TaxID=3154258 RepID=UPI00332C2FE3
MTSPSDHRPFRIALIGVGARAGLAQHVEAAGAVLVATVDPDPAVAQRVTDLFGPDVPRYDDVATLLANHADLDAAIVTSPDDTHHAVTAALLEAGVAAYVEKPLAITTEDADDLLAIAHRTGTRLYVGHNMRHMHVVRLMKEIIDRGEIGQVRAIWCRHFVGAGGDFYFKDWHAERARVTGLLLQKGAHDIDVMHWLAGSSTEEVVAMGDLMVYGDVTSRRDNSDRRMRDWYSTDHWPPLAQTDLNPVIDVEDISMMTMRLGNGVLASYQQCHFTPDYWRSYTVIGTEGRLENFGDGEGGEVRVWNRRSGFLERGHVQHPVVGDADGHGDADALTVAEFVRFARDGSPTDTSPLAARDAVAAGVAATTSLRGGAAPQRVPPVPAEVADYFRAHQVRQQGAAD